MTTIIERIQAAYEADQARRGRKVTQLQELPLAYEDLTTSWLTAALCAKTPGAEVLAFRVDAPDNGSSNRCRMFLDYNAPGRAAGLPPALFCKASQALANRIVLGVSGGAHIETTFYKQMRPHLTIEAPRGWYASFDAHSYNSIVMLGDLTTEVTEFCSHRTVMTRARAESQVRLLGTMHGQSYRKPELKAPLAQLPTWPEYFTRTEAFGMKDGSNQGFLAAESVIPARTFRRYDAVWPATLRSVMRHQELPQALAHGDVHLKNWYVAGNGEMGLSDWQCASRGHWGRDLAYTMATALTVEDRRVWERDLIRLYLDVLAREGGAACGFDEAWDHYRQQLMSALTWWTITLTPAPGMPDMQPRDITMEFIRRIATAIDDLDSLDV